MEGEDEAKSSNPSYIPDQAPASNSHGLTQNNQLVDGMTRNKVLQTFISKIRNDVALCDMIKQRKTRWLKEEDNYAGFLVQEFERGIAKNVANQTTLRSYLSRKLICSPMRISKKYAGRKVGTILFKNTAASTEIAEISAQTHLELEQKCLAALAVASNRSKQAENEAAKRKEKKQNNVKSAQNQGSMPPPETRDKKAASQNANSNQHQVAIKQTSIQLQQYHQHGHSLKHLKFVAHKQGIPMSQQTSHHPLIYPAHGAGRQNSYPAGSSVSHILQSNNAQARPGVPLLLSQEYHASSKVMRPPRIPNPWDCPQHRPPTIQSSAVNSVAQSTNIICTNRNSSDGNMLDLVAGFDNHVSSINNNRDITELLESRPSSTTWPEHSHFFSGNIGESPYITSKSFDDLHECLGGIDIPPNPPHLDLNEGATEATDKKPTQLVESPYVTTKSFDDMHNFGSSAMSHIDLGDPTKTYQSQDCRFNESMLVKSNREVVDTDAIPNCDKVDPRSDKMLSAFSPFDGSQFIQNQQETSNFEDMIRQAAPLARQVVEATYATNYDGIHFRHIAPSARSKYSAPSECVLATFLNNRDMSNYPHTVSASTSEPSSEHSSEDRDVNSSPDCADVQSD